MLNQLTSLRLCGFNKTKKQKTTKNRANNIKIENTFTKLCIHSNLIKKRNNIDIRETIQTKITKKFNRASQPNKLFLTHNTITHVWVM